MPRYNTPPYSPTNTNPRLNSNMDALLQKLLNMKLLAPDHFKIYLIQTLTDRWFLDRPRELFTLLMSIEYKWRLALKAPYGEENAAILASVGEVVEVEPPTDNETEYHRGWDDGRNALREESLGDDAKKAIQEILVSHRLKKSASGRLVCSCNRGSDDVADWSTHVRIRIMNYLKNEFISLSAESKGQD